MKAIVVGFDGGIESAMGLLGVDVARIEGIASAAALADAGVATADLMVVTDIGEATAIPVAKELNPNLRIVVYTTDALPAFVSAQVDLAVDPELLGPDVVAEELVGVGS